MWQWQSLALASLLLALLSGAVQGNFYANINGETQETKIFTDQGTHKDYFGHTVAVHGEVIVVGAYAANTVIPESGSAFSFQMNHTGNETSWTEKDFIAASQIYPHDYFGGSVDMWEHTIVIGAYLDQSVGSKSGSAFVFTLANGKWKEKQKLTSMLSASADYFGQDVGIYKDQIVVGAYGHSDPNSYYNGAAYVFDRFHSSHKWTQQSFLVPFDAQDYQMFGYSVCIHNNTIVIGAYGDSLSGSSTGAVYIFRKVAIEEKEVHTDANEIDEAKNITGGQPWNYEWVEIQKLFPGDPKSHANFGTSVDLSQRIFHTHVGGHQRYSASDFDYNSYDIVVGSNLATGLNSVTGAAYVFRSGANTLWTEHAKLYAHDGVGDERFGSSVAIHGSFIAVGAPEDRSRGTDSGSAYVFELTIAESWTFQRKLIGNDTQPYDNFGSSCALYETTLVIGAEKAFGTVDSSGAAYIFAADGMLPQKPPKIFLNREETEQFVLFLAVLPILLILIPLIVFSGAMYLSSVHKTKTSSVSAGVNDVRGVPQNPYAVTKSPLEEFATLRAHGSSSLSSSSDSSDDNKEMDISMDSSVSSTTPFALSASRHGMLGGSSGSGGDISPGQRLRLQQAGGGLSSLLEKTSRGEKKVEMLGRPRLSSDDLTNSGDPKQFRRKQKSIQEAIDGATEESSPMRQQLEEIYSSPKHSI